MNESDSDQGSDSDGLEMISPTTNPKRRMLDANRPATLQLQNKALQAATGTATPIALFNQDNSSPSTVNPTVHGKSPNRDSIMNRFPKVEGLTNK